jgi:phage baseplate assembly protein W
MAQANLGTDLALELIDSRALSIYRARDEERRSVDGGRGLRIRDFVTAEGRDNLGQALTTRLLTPKGELAPLGHPAYGSRLHEIIGQLNTATTRNLAKLFVIESLKAERRVGKIQSVEVTPHPVNRFLIRIAISVKPIGDDAVIATAFELEL